MWQVIGFLYGIIGVLIGEANCIAMGRVLFQIVVQFLHKLLIILGMCF